MAVEAHHLHLFPSQLLGSREIIDAAERQPNPYNVQMGSVAPVSGAASSAAAAAGSFLPVYNSPAPITTADVSDSGLTFNNAPSRKRSRPLSFLGDDISSHLQQQMLDIDRLVLQHLASVGRRSRFLMLWKWEWQTAKVRAEMAERRKRLMRQILAAMEEGVSKRLKAKEDEIASIGKLNWALEERVKSLCMENQIWRDLALSKEATANVLRTNLEQVLAAQVRVEEGAATATDAESCCCGDNGEDGAEEGIMASGWRSACRSCREREPSVLLLPCRHLCLCAECGPAVAACPVCNCTKNGSVNVNMP
ncbi:hypothetical protein MUK42_30938 [Musa troglodytarum]|uniref:RING-type domain-containing protein n=1 Tax=Musa troglodytarum TaxID=320322 RepID=A0A9E7FJ98_9LILI|nr:hypothetical protein MUK42_30938 [Musa troglodytarum]